MGAIKRKAEQGAAPSKKPKGASTDRSAKRRKSDAEQPSPAKSKPESAAPKPSVFKDEEKSFPRGGASVLTPLEHKQIQIKANQDVLFEQSGEKRTGGGDDGFSDMGSEDEEKNAAKSKKKPLLKKSKKSHDSGEKDDTVRAEGLSYKVRQSLRIARVMLTIAETVAWDHHPRPNHRHLPPGYRTRAPE
jgi:rRNA biogenesis protein RRP5